MKKKNCSGMERDGGVSLRLGAREDSFRKRHFAETWMTGGSQFTQKWKRTEQSKDRGRKEPDMLEEENAVRLGCRQCEVRQSRANIYRHPLSGGQPRAALQPRKDVIWFTSEKDQFSQQWLKWWQALSGPQNGLLSNTQKWIFWGDTHTDTARGFIEKGCLGGE